jgi:hypothetical protein
MRRALAILLLFSVPSWATATSYTFSTNAPTNPFGTSNSIYYATFNLGSSVKTPINGDCLQSYYYAAAHAVTPSWIAMQRQTGCSGAWIPYSGTSWGSGGSSGCDGASPPTGCVFADNARSNDVRGCSLLADPTDNRILCFYYDDLNAGSAVVYVSVSTDDGVNFGAPTLISGYGAAGAGAANMDNGQPCIYITGGTLNTRGTTYDLCSTDGGSTWTNAIQISTNEQQEGAVWWDSSGTNGLVFIRSAAASAPMKLATTINSGATWVDAASDIADVTPACQASGGSVLSHTFVSPYILQPATPSGFITLMFVDREICSGAGGVNNYLLSITFNPTAVIASPSSLPASQVLNLGYLTTAQVDYGYPSIIETSGSNVLFSWYGSYTPYSGRPAIFQMTGAYQSGQHALTISGGSNGTVTSNDGQIRCVNGSGLCGPIIYGTGSQITLTGTGEAGYIFSSCSSPCNSNPYTLTLNSDTTITYTFGPVMPTVVQSGTQVSSGNVVSK